MIGRASGLLDRNPSPAPDEQTLPPRPRNPDLAETVDKDPGESAAQPQHGNLEAGSKEPSPAHEQPPTLSRPRKTKGFTPARPSTCNVCQKHFDSGMQLRQHELWSDRCGVQESPYKRIYFCLRCYLRLPTVEDARRHFGRDRACLDRMSVLKLGLHQEYALPSQLQRIQDAVKAGEARHRYMTLAISEAALSIKSMSCPKIRAIPGGTEHLLWAKKSGGLHGKNLTTTEKISAAPSSQSKGSLKSTKNADPPTRKHVALRQQPLSIDQARPAAAHRTQPKRSAEQPANEATMNPASSREAHVRKVRPLRSDAARRDRKTSTPEQSAQTVPDVALASNPNAALVLQVQQLVEQVRLLTERFLPPTTPVETVLRKEANAATAPLQVTSDVPVVHEAESSTSLQALSVSQEVHDSLILPKHKPPSPTKSNGQTEVTPEHENKSTILPLNKPSKKLAHSHFRYWETEKYSSEARRLLLLQEAKSQGDTPSPKLPQSSRPQNLSDKSKASAHNSGKEEPKPSRRKEGTLKENSELATQANANENVPLDSTKVYDSRNDNQRLTRQIHTQARLMKSSDHSTDTTMQATSQPTTPSAVPATSSSGEMSERSLLDELFPESSSYIQPHYTGRNPYPKLDLPSSVPLVRRELLDQPLSEQEKVAQSFYRSSENITALQLLHCSTELAEADFRRLIPKGRHIEGWTRDGEFTKVIPGRDPITLERLPFYYLLFKSPQSAVSYQKNASRLHKLSQLHQPSSIMSPISPPKGFLEEGEDINLATSSYLLKPPGVPLNLNMVMQPYNASLRALIEQGGYRPIVPFTGDSGKPLYKVLMHIEGYEPSQKDLYQLLAQEGHTRGIQWPFHNEHAGIRRLRDISDLRARLLPVSSANPRAANADRHRSAEDDPSLSFLKLSSEEGENAAQINQMVMNRVYNRWIVEFDDEEAAKRFARLWNRRVLPVSRNAKHVTWRDTEERRMCNTEYLW